LIAATEGTGAQLRIAADSLWRPTGSGLDASVVPAHVDVGSAGNYLALRALYARASFVVVPLHQARFASGYAVIAEAMAMGKAVITTRTEAPSDLLIEGETGFYTEPGDVAGLHDKIVLLLNDPARAQAMGAAGAARMHEQFSLEAYCNRIESLIKA
jgi:glycosyltransferase involved in cell wall biosynthesis